MLINDNKLFQLNILNKIKYLEYDNNKIVI